MAVTLLLMFLSLLCVTLVEIYVVIRVADAIGIVPTLGLMIVDAMLGSLLIRHQARSVWSQFTGTLAEGRIPGRELLDGALVIAGGVFLITPGFVTDFVGAFLLIPRTRAVARRFVVRRLRRRTVYVAAQSLRRTGIDEPPL